MPWNKTKNRQVPSNRGKDERLDNENASKTSHLNELRPESGKIRNRNLLVDRLENTHTNNLIERTIHKLIKTPTA